MLRICGVARKFAHCSAGNPTVEFALIAPIFMGLFYGAYAAFDLARGVKETARTAAIISDLATRSVEMNDDARDALFNAAEALIGKYGVSSDFSITVTSIVNEPDDNSDKLKVAWSIVNNNKKGLETEDIEDLVLPTIPDGESVIHVIAAAKYDPKINFLSAPKVKMQQTAVRRPRFVSEVVYN